MLVVFYIVQIVYTCVFMACSTSLVFMSHLWIHGMYVCM